MDAAQVVVGGWASDHNGGASSFGDLVADGGKPGSFWGKCREFARSLHYRAGGGKGGSNGGASGKLGGFNGEPGQGKWPDFAKIFRHSKIRAGKGGQPGHNGGGGGGVVINELDANNTLAHRGNVGGFGAGGYVVGNRGVVYVEWDTSEAV